MDIDPQSAPIEATDPAFAPSDEAPAPTPVGESVAPATEDAEAAATDATDATDATASTETGPAMIYQGPEALAQVPRRSLTAAEVTAWVRTAEAAQQAFDDGIYAPGPAMPDLPSHTPTG